MLDFLSPISRKWWSFIIFSVLFSFGGQSQKVLYMLRERYGDATNSLFAGEVFSISRLFDGTIVKGADPILHYGGVLIRRLDNDAVADTTSITEYLKEIINERDLLFKEHYTYEHIRCFEFGDPKFRPSYQLELGLYDKSKKIFESKEWRDASIGHLLAIIAHTPIREFKFIISIDISGRKSLLMQTWTDLFPSDFNSKLRSQALKIVTYNLWNTNPHSWAVPDTSRRISKYNDRLRFFAQILREEDADIILLQEVRLDNTFYISASDGGNQMSHLLAHLSGDSPGSAQKWHFLFQPAMSIFDKSNPRARVEEGLGIISKYPLNVDTLQVLLLPRVLTDSSDDHSRIVLRSRIRTSEYFHVDVMTSHLSLSAASREAAIKFIHEIVEMNSSFQVFAGDLNAEPSERAIQLISEGGAFVDAWTFQQGEYQQGNGFTFPACRPTKRIDYIYARNSSGATSSCGYIKRVKIIGTRSKEEIALNSPIVLAPETGMLDEGSLLWASDHFGLSLSVDLSTPDLCTSGHMATDEL